MSAIDTIWRSSSFDNFVTNLPIIFLKALEVTPPDMVRSLYNQVPWNPAQGDRVTFDSYALPQYAERSDGENSSATLLKVAEGDRMTVTQNEYSGKFLYTHRMDTFDKEKLASQFAATTIQAINATIDKEMTDKIFTYAENATYTPKGKSSTVDWTCADGFQLAYNAHTLADGSTFSTVSSTDGALGSTTLSAMYEQGQYGFKNHLGEVVDFDPDTLIIPDDAYMIKKAFELMGSPMDPATSNHTMNIFNTTWKKKIVVLKRSKIQSDCKTAFTTDTARYRYALVDSRYMNNWQYQLSNSPTIQLKDWPDDQVLKAILGISYCAFATVVPQGYILNYSNVAKPQVTD